MARKECTTKIEEEIWNKFHETVKAKGKHMNDVLEEFMKYYSDGFEIIATKKIQ